MLSNQLVFLAKSTRSVQPINCHFYCCFNQPGQFFRCYFKTASLTVQTAKNEKFCTKRYATSCVSIRDGTGPDFLDPTDIFQNLRRATGFFTEGFCSLFNASKEKFSKRGGHGEVLNFVTPDGALRKKTQIAKITQF